MKSEADSGYRNLGKPTLKEQGFKGDPEKVLNKKWQREKILPAARRRGF